MWVMTSMGDMSPARMQILHKHLGVRPHLNHCMQGWQSKGSMGAPGTRRVQTHASRKAVLAASCIPFELLPQRFDDLLDAALDLLPLGGLLGELQHPFGQLCIRQRVCNGDQILRGWPHHCCWLGHALQARQWHQLQFLTIAEDLSLLAGVPLPPQLQQPLQQAPLLLAQLLVRQHHPPRPPPCPSSSSSFSAVPVAPG